MTKNKLKEKMHAFLQDRVTNQLQQLIKERDEVFERFHQLEQETAHQKQIIERQDMLIEQQAIHIQTQARIINHYTTSVLDGYFESEEKESEGESEEKESEGESKEKESEGEFEGESKEKESVPKESTPQVNPRCIVS